MTNNPKTHSSDTARITSADVLRGIKLGFPIFLGYLPVGLAFGILAYQKGFTFLQTVVCSATALAGAGQFIGLATLVAGGDALTVIIATGVVNLRYVLFAATISPYLRSIPIHKLPWIGYTLTDEAFAVNIHDLRSGKANLGSMTGIGIIEWLGWVLGTVIGALGSTWIGDPAAWGVDFAMAAMFAALFVALAEHAKHVITGALAGLLVIILWSLQFVGLSIDSNWFIVVASLVGATIAALIFKDKQTIEELATSDEMIVGSSGTLEESAGVQR